jgi:hypothetical protein
VPRRNEERGSMIDALVIIISTGMIIIMMMTMIRMVITVRGSGVEIILTSMRRKEELMGLLRMMQHHPNTISISDTITTTAAPTKIK